MIFISTEHLEFFSQHVGRLLLPLLVKLLYDQRLRTAFFFFFYLFAVYCSSHCHNKLEAQVKGVESDHVAALKVPCGVFDS